MLDVATLDGALTRVGPADITALRDSLRGQVIMAGEPDYEGARRVWNGNGTDAVLRAPVDADVPFAENALHRRRKATATGAIVRAFSD